MSMDTNQIRSRRALLGAGLAAAAATAASALPAAATVTYLEVDAHTTGTGTTQLTSDADALKVDCTHGKAIEGISGDGFGVYAVASPDGWALSTHGRLDLSTAGVAAISPGETTKKVYGGTDISSSSFVLLTPALDIGTRRLWWTKDTVDNSFTIHMSSSRSTLTKVSWLLIG